MAKHPKSPKQNLLNAKSKLTPFIPGPSSKQNQTQTVYIWRLFQANFTGSGDCAFKRSPRPHRGFPAALKSGVCPNLSMTLMGAPLASERPEALRVPKRSCFLQPRNSSDQETSWFKLLSITVGNQTEATRKIWNDILATMALRRGATTAKNDPPRRLMKETMYLLLARTTQSVFVWRLFMVSNENNKTRVFGGSKGTFCFGLWYFFSFLPDYSWATMMIHGSASPTPAGPWAARLFHKILH